MIFAQARPFIFKGRVWTILSKSVTYKVLCFSKKDKFRFSCLHTVCLCFCPTLVYPLQMCKAKWGKFWIFRITFACHFTLYIWSLDINRVCILLDMSAPCSAFWISLRMLKQVIVYRTMYNAQMYRGCICVWKCGCLIKMWTKAVTLILCS